MEGCLELVELGLVEADEGMHILEISAGVVLGYILYLVLFLAGVLEQNFDGAPLEAVYEDHREVVGSLNQKTRGQIKDILPLESTQERLHCCSLWEITRK